MGSGKTYLCELIGAFAGPAKNAKVSYPTTSEEATKVVLSLLLTSPACVEFDDMDADWIPHGIIKRMLTAETITDRILGREQDGDGQHTDPASRIRKQRWPDTRSAAARTNDSSRPTLCDTGDKDVQRRASR